MDNGWEHNEDHSDNNHEEADQLFDDEPAPEGDSPVEEDKSEDDPLLDVISDIRAPRDSEVKFTWGDIADFANFCLTHAQLSEEQKELFHGLAGVRTNDTVIAVAQNLEKEPERARGLGIILPYLEKAANSNLGFADGAHLNNHVVEATPEERNGIVRVLNAFIDDDANEKRISFRRNMTSDDLVDKIGEKLTAMMGSRAQEAVETVSVLSELIKMWPGERTE